MTRNRVSTNFDDDDFVFNLLSSDEESLDESSEFEQESYHSSMRLTIHNRSHRETEKWYLRQLTLLESQNDVLSTLCGIRIHTYVVQSAIKIQAVYRGRLLRFDKQIFDKCVSFFIRSCRMVIARKRFLRLKEKCKFIQACFRGRHVRNTPIGKAIQHVVEIRKEISDLELTLLRIGNYRRIIPMACLPSYHSYLYQ